MAWHASAILRGSVSLARKAQRIFASQITRDHFESKATNGPKGAERYMGLFGLSAGRALGDSLGREYTYVRIGSWGDRERTDIVTIQARSNLRWVGIGVHRLSGGPTI